MNVADLRTLAVPVGLTLCLSTAMGASPPDVDCAAAGVACTGSVLDESPSFNNLSSGNIDAGTVVISSGSPTSYDTPQSVYAGFDRVAVGAIVVRNAQQWSIHHSLTVGLSGHGAFVVEDGSTVNVFHENDERFCPCPTTIGNSEGSSGVLTVRDGGFLNLFDGHPPPLRDSGELVVARGDFGSETTSGVLNVTTGGAVSAQFVTIARDTNAAGTVNVDGVSEDNVASTLSSRGRIVLADTLGAQAALNVSNDSRVTLSSSDYFELGELIIGPAGTGHVWVRKGGRIDITRPAGDPFALDPIGIVIGGTVMPDRFGAKTGTMTVVGPISAVAVGGDNGIEFLEVGRGLNPLVDAGSIAYGDLAVLNGGRVTLRNNDGISLGAIATSVLAEGEVTVSGEDSLLDTGQLLACGRSLGNAIGAVSVGEEALGGEGGTGSMMARDRGFIRAVEIVVGPKCVASGDGTYDGNTIVQGVLSPGVLTGTMTIGRDLTVRPGGIVRLQVNGLGLPDHDEIRADNIAFRAGSICQITLEAGIGLAELADIQMLFANPVDGTISGTTTVVVTDQLGSERAVARDVDLAEAGGCAAAIAGGEIEDICPCEGPADGSGEPWKNHRKYVVCVVHAVKDRVEQGIIDRTEAKEIISAAKKSDCGKKNGGSGSGGSGSGSSGSGGSGS